MKQQALDSFREEHLVHRLTHLEELLPGKLGQVMQKVKKWDWRLTDNLQFRIMSQNWKEIKDTLEIVT